MAIQRDFQDILTDLDDGKVHQQLGEQLATLVRAVVATAKQGKLVLDLTIKPDGSRTFLAVAKVKTTLPQGATDATRFYATDEGTLTRSDPKQLPLKHVGPRSVSDA